MSGESSSMNYELFTPLVWFLACLISFVIITILRRKDSSVFNENIKESQGRVLAKIFSIYLVMHIISNAFNLTAYALPQYSYSIQTIGNLVVAIAAPVYIVLSTALIFNGQFLYFKNAMLIGTLIYIPYFLIYISVPNDTRILLLFSFYLVAATYAYIGTWFVFHRHGYKSEKREYQAFFFVFASTIGMIDFLLPAFAFLFNKEKMKEFSFLGRVLDSIFYLPIVIACIVWLDTKDMYHINSNQDGAKYKEDSNILLDERNNNAADDEDNDRNSLKKKKSNKNTRRKPSKVATKI